VNLKRQLDQFRPQAADFFLAGFFFPVAADLFTAPAPDNLIFQ
jgi:hypothetical protein